MTSFARRPLTFGFLLSLAACAPAAPPGSSPVPAYFRVVDGRTHAASTFDRMAARLGRSRVVFFGEQHGDPETHRAELELLNAIERSGRPVIVSLEMFERDVQPVLDDYLAGRLSEQDFLARSRPWPRYATDYRPLVELAKARGWRVVASNVPRPIASAIGRAGLRVLDTLGARSLASSEVSCPDDAYRSRFLDQMRAHSSGPGGAQSGDSLPTAVAERFYLAQCVKDETMAESIVNALRSASADAIAVHFNGAFHSEYGQGVVERVRRREPRWDLATVAAIPVGEPATAADAAHDGLADYLVFTRRPN